MNNLHPPKRPVIAGIAGSASNILDERNGGVVALAEDRVVPVQVRRGHLGDKKLRTVGIWAGVRIGEASSFIEQQVGGNFILKLIPGIARSIACGIAALNHEIRNYAMKNRAVVEGNTVLGDSFDRLPVFGPGGEPDKILHASRCFVWKQRTSHVPYSSFNDRSRLAGRRMVHERLRRRRGLRTRLSPGERGHRKQKRN